MTVWLRYLSLLVLPRIRHCESNYQSLRGAKRRSNPYVLTGLLRYARNDCVGSLAMTVWDRRNDGWIATMTVGSLSVIASSAAHLSLRVKLPVIARSKATKQSIRITGLLRYARNDCGIAAMTVWDRRNDG